MKAAYLSPSVHYQGFPSASSKDTTPEERHYSLRLRANQGGVDSVLSILVWKVEAEYFRLFLIVTNFKICRSLA